MDKKHSLNLKLMVKNTSYFILCDLVHWLYPIKEMELPIWDILKGKARLSFWDGGRKQQQSYLISIIEAGSDKFCHAAINHNKIFGPVSFYASDTVNQAASIRNKWSSRFNYEIQISRKNQLTNLHQSLQTKCFDQNFTWSKNPFCQLSNVFTKKIPRGSEKIHIYLDHMRHQICCCTNNNFIQLKD